MSLINELLAFDFDPFAFGGETLAQDWAGSARESDVDGRLRVRGCNISKATVSPYFGREIPDWQGLNLDPNRVYYLYRDPQELARAADSFRSVQLLDLHTQVSAKDPKQMRVCGAIGTDVCFDAPYLRASLAVWTAAARELIESRKASELSCSYRYRADMTPGVTPFGVSYDGVMRDIIGNHVALVPRGRAGPDVMVADELPLTLSELSPMKYPNLYRAVQGLLAPGVTPAQVELAMDRARDSKRAKDKDVEEREAAEEAMDAREHAVDEREHAADEREHASDANPEAPEAKDRKAARDSRKAARDSRKAARDKRAHDRKAARDARAKDDTPGEPTQPGPREGVEGGAHNPASDALSAALASGRVVSLDDARKLANDAANAAIAGARATAAALDKVKPLVGIITAPMANDSAVYRHTLTQLKVAHDGIPDAALPHIVDAQLAVRDARSGSGSRVLASDSSRRDVSRALPV